MTIIAHRRRETRPHVNPLRTEILAERITRCGVCQRLWPERDMRDEDGIDKCPNDVDVTTETYKAAILETEAEKAERYVITPNIAQVPMEISIPATVMSVFVGDGEIYAGNPAPIYVGGEYVTLLVIGRGFSGDDIVAFSSNISQQDKNVTATLVTLTISADFGAGPASITYADNVLRNILEVR